MTDNAHHLPESWLTQLGAGDASGWLAAFLRSPPQAVADLLWDRFYFGPLNVMERGQLLAGWLDQLGNREGFSERLDEALNGWIVGNWGRFGHVAEKLVSAWSCACSVVEYSAGLPKESRLNSCGAALMDRFVERQSFLGSFSTAPAADPLGLYLAAVAEFQGRNRSFAGFWHRTCDLPDGVPFYHAPYAMLGLRRLAPADASENGTLRAEVVLGLLRLARGFDRLERERGLSEKIARSSFRRVAVRTAAAYPDSPRWRDHGLAECLELPERPRRWLLDAVPPLAEAVRQESHSAQRHHRARMSIEPDPSWPSRARELAAALGRADLECLPEVERLLNAQRHYAESTGDTYFVVRTLCNFASRIRRFRPPLALSWADESRRWEPHNAFTWTTIKDVLLKLGKVKAALRFAWVASKRFPENAVAQNGLAEVFKVAGRYDESAEVFRQTIERFPEDVFAHNGLAEALKACENYDEAIKVYRQTIERFPDNVVARTGLAELLKSGEHYDEAVKVFRQTIERFPDHVVARTGLAEALKACEHYDEAIEVYRETVTCFPENTFARNGLADALRRAGRWDDAEEQYRRNIDSGHADCVTFVGLAQVLLHKGAARRDEAMELVERAIELDPRDSHALLLKQQLEPESDVDAAEMADKWDQIADDLFAPPVVTGGPDEDAGEPVEKQVHTVDSVKPVQEEGQGLDTGKPPAPADGESEAEDAREPLPEEAPSVESDEPVQAADERLPTGKSPTPADGESDAEDAREPLPEKAPSVESDEPVQAADERLPAGKPPARAVSKSEAVAEFRSPDQVVFGALVAEACFYRLWARDGDDQTAAARRRKAADLLAEAERLSPLDPQLLAEKAALAIAEGNEPEVDRQLTPQLSSRPAAAPLLLLKARLDRQAAREENRPLNDSTLADLCLVPQRLRDLDRALTPLYHLQSGLAALALVDGTRRVGTAADAFSNFRRTVARRASEERVDRESSRDSRQKETPRFHEWLHTQVNNRLLPELSGQDTIRGDDIPVVERATVDRPQVFEEVEDAFVDRLALAAF